MKKIAAALALAACAAGPGFTPALQAQEEVEPWFADIVQDGETWTARFTVPEGAPIWAFHRSALQRISETPWRPESWRVLTPGVTLTRIGNFDALVADEGTLAGEVVIEFTPHAVDLLADYDPALRFSNGSVALFSGHFSAFPVQSVSELDALTRPQGYTHQISMRTPGNRVLHGGEWQNEASQLVDAYVVFGPVDLVEGEQVSTILDPGLPQWMPPHLRAMSEDTFIYYSARLGDHAQGRPTIIASWAGPTAEMVSMGGSVTGNMISLAFEGEGLLRERARPLQRARWFIGHEAAHFWLGQLIAYDDRKDSWITEGGADLMAIRLIGARGDGEELNSETLIAQAREDCANLLPNGGVYTAAERLEHRAYYACGSVFSLAVEQAGAVRGKDFFGFVSKLIERHRAENIGTEEWLAVARDFGLSEGKAQQIRELLDNGAQDGAAAISRLLDS